MIADLKPYPEMKDSGVPWLGEVPEHWEVLPALATYKLKFIKNTGMIETTVLSLSYGLLLSNHQETSRARSRVFETYQIVDPGNFIVRHDSIYRTSMAAFGSGILGIAALSPRPIVFSNRGSGFERVWLSVPQHL